MMPRPEATQTHRENAGPGRRFATSILPWTSEDQLRHVAARRRRGGRARAGPHFGAQQPQSLCDETSEAHFTCGERDLHLMSLAVGQRANQTIVSSPVNRFLDIPDAHHFTPFLLCQVSGHFGKRRIPGAR
ncbi:hypothetical protein ACNHE5_23695 [Pandoraea pnomenusa]|jgi:hypothetical protein|uniref:hypothetical protein n=1 Tax=Pandoraea TaxID=93217 RepID=UPI0011866A12|nr:MULTISPECIES: hypothetical protein [Pandoraea]